MSPTKQTPKTDAIEPAQTLHLVTPKSQGKPLCGETSPDAAIGAYCEHLDDKGEWCREVLGKDGKPSKVCADCLSRYPSTLYRKSSTSEDGWPFFVMLAKWHIGGIAIPLLIWFL